MDPNSLQYDQIFMEEEQIQAENKQNSSINFQGGQCLKFQENYERIPQICQDKIQSERNKTDAVKLKMLCGLIQKIQRLSKIFFINQELVMKISDIKFWQQVRIIKNKILHKTQLLTRQIQKRLAPKNYEPALKPRKVEFPNSKNMIKTKKIQKKIQWYRKSREIIQNINRLANINKEKQNCVGKYEIRRKLNFQ